ncbi:rhomboid family intramembrane serine protease [Halovenus marina]|uniref:rhomboid family intramembrane serine protease n=1 Tax=Halovenus marina TaxID=3396621 RepID=UPI003F556DBD
MVERSGQPVFELLAVFVLVFLLQFVTAVTGLVGGLFVLSAPLLDRPWTVFTSVYAHANLSHLVSNGVALLIFGWPIARSTTRPRFHAFFLLTGAATGVSQILLSSLLAELPLVEFAATAGVLGASGGVFALLGYLLASNRLSSRVGAALSVSRRVQFVAFVVIAALLTAATASPGVALIAHFVGLLLGLLTGKFSMLSVDTPATEPVKV